MKKKAIIFDLDGTAIDSPEKRLPSQKLVDTIATLKDNYYFSSATGRGWAFGGHIIQALGLTDPCIISAGTQICDPVSGKILWQKNIDPDAVHQVLEIFKQNPKYKMNHNDYTEEDYTNGGVYYPNDFPTSEDVYFIEQIFVPESIALKLYEQLQKIKGITCILILSQKPETRDLHIVNHQATKEYAVAELLKMLTVNVKDTIGIGDGHNDIHLFNAVHHKVAMGNAVSELKNAADQIIDTIKNDGMATYLQTLKNVRG